MTTLQVPEGLFVVEGLPPTVGAAAPLVADYISLKNAQMCWVVVHYHQGDADNQTFTMYRSLLVASGAAVLVNTVPIWSNLDCETSNTLVRRTDAINYAGGTGTTHKIVIFQIDPANLGGSYDCITVGTAGNVAATSYMSVLYLLQPRHSSQVADQASFITD
jgi:hypothetical protein